MFNSVADFSSLCFSFTVLVDLLLVVVCVWVMFFWDTSVVRLLLDAFGFGICSCYCVAGFYFQIGWFSYVLFATCAWCGGFVCW